MAFNCDKCGLCCQLIANIPQLAAYDRGDGVCRYLHNNLCTIYESRPEICNADLMYSHFSNKFSRQEYDELLERSCKLIKEHLMAKQQRKE